MTIEELCIEDPVIGKQISGLLYEHGHTDLSEVTAIDALDMIAGFCDGWPAMLAALVYYQEIGK